MRTVLAEINSIELAKSNHGWEIFGQPAHIAMLVDHDILDYHCQNNFPFL